MMKNPCNTCGKFAHWHKHHNSVGSLPAITKVADSQQNPSSTISGESKYTLKFNVPVVTDINGMSSSISVNTVHEPLFDDGAPNSAISSGQLQIFSDHLRVNTESPLVSIPSSLAGCTHWQYGPGTHSSAKSCNHGSIFVSLVSDSSRTVMSCHVVLDGSSQCVLGQNVTRCVDIEHVR